jgi:DNA-binding Lrp family transcriptional regulator
VFVTVHPQTWQSFRARISEMPDIESCRVTTGEHDAMLLVRAGDVGSIHDFVIGVIALLPEVKSVETVLVLDEVMQRPYLLPTDLVAREQSVAEMGLMRFTHTNPDRPGRS